MTKEKDRSYLVWLDLETTGLSVETAAILEVALVITDKGLNVVAEAPPLVVHQDEEVLARMDPWAARQHTRSGLVEEVRRSTLSLEEAERTFLALVRGHCPPRSCPLCGNSISFDRRFLMRYMPRLEGHLSYRNVDVSSVKELVARWYPDRAFREKASKHRALSDLRESIEELRHYRTAVFRSPDE